MIPIASTQTLKITLRDSIEMFLLKVNNLLFKNNNIYYYYYFTVQ